MCLLLGERRLFPSECSRCWCIMNTMLCSGLEEPIKSPYPSTRPADTQGSEAAG